MEVWIHRYALEARGALNAREDRLGFEGILLSYDGGYGCVHPWAALGDPDVDEEIERFRAGNLSRLGRRALDCCRVDAQARREGRWLFEGLNVPESHFTMAGGVSGVPAGFRAVKLKGGRDWARVVSQLGSLREELGVRVDFNETLSPEEFLAFAGALGALKGRIDFVEDPCPFDEAVWNDLAEAIGLRLAVDRDGDRASTRWLRVVKPAVEPVPDTASEVLFTSYMDHPLGQVWAAYEAARWMKASGRGLPLCGLVTQHLWEPGDPFVAALGAAEPVLRPPSGTGLGFDELWDELRWERIG